jgi:hypothetical protein
MYVVKDYTHHIGQSEWYGKSGVFVPIGGRIA